MLLLGLPVAAMAVAGSVFGAPKNSFKKGDPVSSTLINENFADLDARATTAWAAYACELVDHDTKVAIGNDDTLCFWRRDGDSIDVRIRTVFTGAPTPSHQLDWSLPPGITIDPSKLPDAAATRNVVGVVFVGGSTSTMGVVKEFGGGIVAQLQGGGSNLNSSDAFIAAGATIRLDFSVPVNP